MRGRFSTRPQKSHILAHDELKFSPQPRFDRSYVDLAVPLGRVGIADRKQGARDMDRHVQRCASPVLRTLSLCTCCRHYPGAAAGRMVSLGNPVVSAFPERVIGSACASSFSRLARRSLALRPAHSRCHQFVTRIPKASAISSPPQLLRLLPAGAVRRVGLDPLESAALPRRTPKADSALAGSIV